MSPGWSVLERLAKRRREETPPHPLLVELFGPPSGGHEKAYEIFPFLYEVEQRGQDFVYSISFLPHGPQVEELRRAVAIVEESLDPEMVDPATFPRLVAVASQLGAEGLSGVEAALVKPFSELVAYEAIGLSRLLALAKDRKVTEFFADSDSTPLYLDHLTAGRCETSIVLTEREQRALETHLDTFRGYTLDYGTPSMTNDMDVSGERLRVSLDVDPVAANRFSLDVRRLNLTSLPLGTLVKQNVISAEGAAFLLAWLELGGNVTVIGETGTGKTTLMNALDESLDRRLRRIYIEDAIETRDLLERGYHQVKVKVDPLERGRAGSKGKGHEILKALHRSPDLVVLSEIQSEDHSRAFFQALSSGVRGMQTFHASSIEQAVRRWTNIHRIPKESIQELGVLVQMKRPDRLKPSRTVSRICQVVGGEPPVIRELFARSRDDTLVMVAEWSRVAAPVGSGVEELRRRANVVTRRGDPNAN
jgi:type IV secretory pathway ATPase VirB11/archaellum biosynthesis ATPase